MQGWRRTMEDASLVRLKLKENVDLFGVFDGHGGIGNEKDIIRKRSGSSGSEKTSS